MCKPPVRFLLRSEASAWLAEVTSCVMSCLKLALRSKPRAILWVGCTMQTYQRPHDHEVALKANSCLIQGHKLLICWKAVKVNLCSIRVTFAPCIYPFLLDKCNLTKIPTFIKCDMTLQIKIIHNERYQNHLPTLKVQAGLQRSYERPGLCFQKEEAQMTFEDL